MARAAPISAPRAPWPWAFGGAALGVAAAALLFAPARWLAGPLERATNGHLRLAEPRGTVWTGSAQLLLAGGAGSTDVTALPNRVDWRLSPRWDGLLLQLEPGCCTALPPGGAHGAALGRNALAVANSKPHGPPLAWPVGNTLEHVAVQRGTGP